MAATQTSQDDREGSARLYVMQQTLGNLLDVMNYENAANGGTFSSRSPARLLVTTCPCRRRSNLGPLRRSKMRPLLVVFSLPGSEF